MLRLTGFFYLSEARGLDQPEEWELTITFEDGEAQAAAAPGTLGGMAEALVAGLLAGLMAEETVTLRLTSVGTGRIALEACCWPWGVGG